MPRKRRESPEFYLKPDATGIYKIHWSENRRTRRISTGTKDEAEAKRILASHIAGWHAAPEMVLVGDIIRHYLEYKKKKYEERGDHPRNYQLVAYALAPVESAVGHLSWDQLDTRQIEALKNGWRENKLSNGTIRKRLNIFKASLNFCHRDGWIDKVPRFEMPPSPPARDLWMRAEQVHIILGDIGNHHLKVFILLALHTLSRKSAILELSWQQVDLDRRLIDFNPPDRVETIKRRVPVPIESDALYQALVEARELAVTDWVIEYNGRPVADIKRAFASHAKARGLKWVTPHVLRHTGATLMMQRGVPISQIAAIMGDKIQTVERHYLKHHPDYLKVAVTALKDLYG